MDKVTLPGRIAQADLPAYHRKADLYISPSHVDGSSVSLMEALACGLPVLVSDIPGNIPWVEEAKNGWTFPDGNVDNLVEKILFASNNTAQLPAMGSEARNTALKEANWKVNFQKLLQTYQDTLAAANQVNR